MKLNIFELFLNPFQGKRYLTQNEEFINIPQEEKKKYYVDHVSISANGDFLIIVYI